MDLLLKHGEMEQRQTVISSILFQLFDQDRRMHVAQEAHVLVASSLAVYHLACFDFESLLADLLMELVVICALVSRLLLQLDAGCDGRVTSGHVLDQLKDSLLVVDSLTWIEFYRRRHPGPQKTLNYLCNFKRVLREHEISIECGDSECNSTIYLL